MKLAPYAPPADYAVDDRVPEDARCVVYTHLGNAFCNLCGGLTGAKHVWSDLREATSAGLVRAWAAVTRRGTTTHGIVEELRPELVKFDEVTDFGRIYTAIVRKTILLLVDDHLTRVKVTMLVRRELHHLNCIRYACPALLRHDVCDDPEHMPCVAPYDIYTDHVTEEN
jgi:hypothetical protein